MEHSEYQDKKTATTTYQDIRNNIENTTTDIKLLSPNSGDLWIPGHKYTVTWTPIPSEVLTNLIGSDMHVEVWLIGVQNNIQVQIGTALIYATSTTITEYEVPLVMTTSPNTSFVEGQYLVQLRFFNKDTAKPCGIYIDENTLCLHPDEKNYGLVAQGTSIGPINLNYIDL
ncbi:MAG: hypothetical protein RIQ72_155 [Candidatus Parcubacteria bacterium]